MCYALLRAHAHRVLVGALESDVLADSGLQGNPCCADELSGHSEADYAEYRRQLVLAFPQLGWVDSTNTAKDRTIDGHMSCPYLSSTSIPTWVGQDPVSP